MNVTLAARIAVPTVAAMVLDSAAVDASVAVNTPFASVTPLLGEITLPVPDTVRVTG